MTASTKIGIGAFCSVALVVALTLSGVFKPKSIPAPDAPQLGHVHFEDMNTAASGCNLQAPIDLVPTTSATSNVIQSGRWTDPNTWDNAPATDGMVYVPPGLTVTFDAPSTPKLKWLRVDGTFVTDPTVVKSLWCETIVTLPGSSFVVGTAAAPDSGFSVLFADYGPINTATDTTMVGRGLLAEGPVSIYGNAVTPWAFSLGNNKGDTTITLTVPETGWKVGDQLLLPGTHCEINDDDLATISAIDPTQTIITLAAPLANNHRQATLTYAGQFTELPPPGLMSGWDRPAKVVNVSKRSVDFASENTATILQRGHIMLMNSNASVFRYVSLTELGRTDKSKEITDPDGLGNGLANPRARYALHSHINGGLYGTTTPADIYGCFVRGSPGWGIVNHSSYSNIDLCAAWQVYGADFVGENGEEIGVIRNCAGFRSRNQTATIGFGPQIDNPGQSANWGTTGQAVWTQGGGITVSNCYAWNKRSAGFVFMGQVFQIPGKQMAAFNLANLQPMGYQTPQVGPAGLNCGNIPFAHHDLTAVGCGAGYGPWGMNQQNADHGLIQTLASTPTNPIWARSSIRNCYMEVGGTTSGSIVAEMIGYSGQIDRANIKAICYSANGLFAGANTALTHSGFSTATTLNQNPGEQAVVLGFAVANHAPTENTCSIANLTTDAPTGIYNTQPPTVAFYKNLSISNISMLSMTAAQQAAVSKNTVLFWVYKLQGSQQRNVACQMAQGGESIYSSTATVPDVTFPHYTIPQAPHDITKDHLTLDGAELFFPEQGPNFALSNLPSITDAGGMPFLKGLTVGQMQAQYNVTIGGKILPSDATMHPTAYALYSPSGTASVNWPQLSVSSPNGNQIQQYQQTNQTTGFVLSVKNVATGTMITNANPVNLNAGWNIVPVDGMNQGVFVWSGPGTFPPPWKVTK